MSQMDVQDCYCRTVMCDECAGAGDVPCEFCGGSGETMEGDDTFCQECEGTGRVDCPECHGFGEVDIKCSLHGGQ